jgi:hypothetical protein
VDELFPRIKALAEADNAQWGGGDINRGYTQITTEWIPIRTRQLLQVYAPGGLRPLLPGPQDNKAVQLAVGRRDSQYVEIVNSGGDAVDVSAWTLTGGQSPWALPGGAVIPGNSSMFLTPDVRAFRNRGSSPRGGEGLLVVYAPQDLVTAGSISLKDDSGNSIF